MASSRSRSPPPLRRRGDSQEATGEPHQAIRLTARRREGTEHEHKRPHRSGGTSRHQRDRSADRRQKMGEEMDDHDEDLEDEDAEQHEDGLANHGAHGRRRQHSNCSRDRRRDADIRHEGNERPRDRRRQQHDYNDEPRLNHGRHEEVERDVRRDVRPAVRRDDSRDTRINLGKRLENLANRKRAEAKPEQKREASVDPKEEPPEEVSPQKEFFAWAKKQRHKDTWVLAGKALVDSKSLQRLSVEGQRILREGYSETDTTVLEIRAEVQLSRGKISPPLKKLELDPKTQPSPEELKNGNKSISTKVIVLTDSGEIHAVVNGEKHPLCPALIIVGILEHKEGSDDQKKGMSQSFFSSMNSSPLALMG